jgi:hypothetical protein
MFARPFEVSPQALLLPQIVNQITMVATPLATGLPFYWMFFMQRRHGATIHVKTA